MRQRRRTSGGKDGTGPGPDPAPTRELSEKLQALKEIRAAIRTLANGADDVIHKFEELDDDLAGPVYQKVLGTQGAADGAYYTKASTAVLLGRLLLPTAMIDWTDTEAVKKLRMIDPACGTGTLLSGLLKTIKDRNAEARTTAGLATDPPPHTGRPSSTCCAA